MKTQGSLSRRKFIGLSCAAAGYTTLFSSLISTKALASSLASYGSFAAGDYKALVFLMLHGGNDSYNMLIPRGTNEYAEYAITRSNLAIPQSEILPLNPLTSDGRLFGLHPALPDLKDLFENQKLAFLCNVGTLVEPSTKAELLNGTVRAPLGLFSHSDQQRQWHTGRPHERGNIGWGGRIADLTRTLNENQRISMNISLEGINLFQYGQTVVPYVINDSGSIGIRDYNNQDAFSQLRRAALDSMLEHDYQDVFKNTYADTVRTSNDSSLEFQSAIDAIPEFTTPYTENALSAQLLSLIHI